MPILKDKLNVKINNKNLEFPLSSENFKLLVGDEALKAYSGSSLKAEKLTNINAAVSFIPKEVAPFVTKKLAGHRFADLVIALNSTEPEFQEAAKFSNLLLSFFDCLGLIESGIKTSPIMTAGAIIENAVLKEHNRKLNKNYVDVDNYTKPDKESPFYLNFFSPEYQSKIKYPEDVKQTFKNINKLNYFGGIPDGVAFLGEEDKIPMIDLSKNILEIKTFASNKFIYKKDNNFDEFVLQVDNNGYPIENPKYEPGEGEKKWKDNKGNFKCPPAYLLQAALYTILSGSKKDTFTLGFAALDAKDYAHPEDFDPTKHKIEFKTVSFDRKKILKYMLQAADFIKNFVTKGVSPNISDKLDWYINVFSNIVKRQEYLKILQQQEIPEPQKLELEKLLDFNSEKFNWREPVVSINNIFNDFSNEFKKVSGKDIINLHKEYLININKQQEQIVETIKTELSTNQSKGQSIK